MTPRLLYTVGAVPVARIRDLIRQPYIGSFSQRLVSPVLNMNSSIRCQYPAGTHVIYRFRSQFEMSHQYIHIFCLCCDEERSSLVFIRIDKSTKSPQTYNGSGRFNEGL